MTRTPLHPWTLDPDEAIRLQEFLREHLVLEWDGRMVNTIGGLDVNYTGDIARVAISVMTYPDMAPLSVATSDLRMVFQYVPGLLAFRAGPAVLATWDKLMLTPDLIMIHGHGTAHPRGIGLASHIGLWLNLPTIGVAKTKVYGYHSEAGSQVGDWSELLSERDPSRVVGAFLRTRVNVKPIYVSAGHLIDLQHSVQLMLACCRGFRMPEPIRAAHKATANF